MEQDLIIGLVVDAVHAALDAWLGTPRRDQKEGTVTLTYHVSSEIAPIVQLRRKGREFRMISKKHGGWLKPRC